MRRLTAVAFAALLVACRAGLPLPVPTPTPPPLPTYDTNRVLRVAAGRLTLLDGTPFHLDMGVQCCMEAPAAVGVSWWPMAGESQMDYFKSFGLNAVHFRLGPFGTLARGESEWTPTGGAYIGSTPEFNPAFWSRVEALVQYAYDKEMWVEIDLIDTWYCKHAASNWGDQHMPWPQADIDACGISMTPVQENFIRKAVRVLGKFPNVIWTTDNEGNQILGTTRAWYEAQVPIIRDEEAKNSHPAHLIGTNNEDFADGPFDYVSTHVRSALITPIAGKWTLNNERNPEFGVQQEINNFRQARSVGLSYAFWRGGMDEATMELVLDGYRQVIAGGEGSTGCSTDPGVVDRITCKLHQGRGLYDCTPKKNGGPIRPEGDPERSACEAAAMGGWPSYTVAGAGLSVEPAANPMQFMLRGSGSGIVSCTVPRTGAVDLCRTPVSR